MAGLAAGALAGAVLAIARHMSGAEITGTEVFVAGAVGSIGWQISSGLINSKDRRKFAKSVIESEGIQLFFSEIKKQGLPNITILEQWSLRHVISDCQIYLSRKKEVAK